MDRESTLFRNKMAEDHTFSKINYNSAVDNTQSNQLSDTTSNRRRSSFATTTSPWYRRNSFLSHSMIENEDFSVYELPNYFTDCSSYNIISLRESQGFVFNQDLFASPYQQSKSLATEKKLRSLSYSGTSSKSRSKSQSTPEKHLFSKPNSGRRYSYHSLSPTFMRSSSISNDESKIAPPPNIEKVNSDYKLRASNNDSDGSTMYMDAFEESDEAIVDEYDESDVEDMEDDTIRSRGSASTSYKVHVTEIIVNDNDKSIFPSDM
ncbi:Piso0_000945 [Millerozyma farinosa CBS 7064]|uniref:Piso0_000945 protein n=1 Tax=Pichia sorbitophila (strain ATCC MYA-4447 / BCRC 22081 / CBS 7064 / NBRC 10061 / NRRL Y-12695) TaxID=559304 RepID=G8YRY7_PICSO|nr:Piso0_000945 [Millerozyma farinosa CBS 7064]